MSLAFAGLPYGDRPPAEALAAGLTLARASGCAAVQLDATAPGMRARELDRSARRDIAATIKRHGLGFSGLDAWIPETHFASPQHADRAIEAVAQACGLAGELARLTESRPAVVCVTLPEEPSAELVSAIVAGAMSAGVRVADFSAGLTEPGAIIGTGFDPASEITAGADVLNCAAARSGGIIDARLTDASKFGRVPVGQGVLDVREYRAVLTTVSTVRSITIDVRGLPDPITAVRLAADEWEGAAV